MTTNLEIEIALEWAERLLLNQLWEATSCSFPATLHLDGLYSWAISVSDPRGRLCARLNTCDLINPGPNIPLPRAEAFGLMKEDDFQNLNSSQTSIVGKIQSLNRIEAQAWIERRPRPS